MGRRDASSSTSLLAVSRERLRRRRASPRDEEVAHVSMRAGRAIGAAQTPPRYQVAAARGRIRRSRRSRSDSSAESRDSACARRSARRASPARGIRRRAATGGGPSRALHLTTGDPARADAPSSADQGPGPNMPAGSCLQVTGTARTLMRPARFARWRRRRERGAPAWIAFGEQQEPAAHSVNRAANSADPPTLLVTIARTLEHAQARRWAARRRSSEVAGRSALVGVHGLTSRPLRSRKRAATRSAQAAFTGAPTANWITSRQSPELVAEPLDHHRPVIRTPSPRAGPPGRRAGW